jgi:hypothetical protein
MSARRYPVVYALFSAPIQHTGGTEVEDFHWCGASSILPSWREARREEVGRLGQAGGVIWSVPFQLFHPVLWKWNEYSENMYPG